MNWKSTAIVSSATVMATWFRMSTPAPTPAVSAPSVPPPAASVVAASADIAQQAARLEANLRAQAEYREPSRNPFRFTTPPSRALVRTVPSIDVAPPSPVVAADVAPSPAVRLEGIASDEANGGMVRTAILTTAAGLQLAREGEMVGEYRVTKIEEESVELTAADGTTLAVALK